MRKPQADLVAAFEPVRRAAAPLPGIEFGTSYGTPALRVRGKYLVRIREDGESLALRTDFDSRDAMLAMEPDVFYTTDHYRNYPAVLVRLSAVRPAQLAQILADSWRVVAPKSLLATQAAAPAPRKRRKTATKRRAAK